MSEKMTATPKQTLEEALCTLGTLKKWVIASGLSPACGFCMGIDYAIAALIASTPHVLTLDEAREMEPHTPVWLEYRVSSIKTITGWRSLCWILYAPAAIKRYVMRNRVSELTPAARIWGGAWPSEELRAATPWLDDDSGK